VARESETPLSDRGRWRSRGRMCQSGPACGAHPVREAEREKRGRREEMRGGRVRGSEGDRESGNERGEGERGGEIEKEKFTVTLVRFDSLIKYLNESLYSTVNLSKLMHIATCAGKRCMP